MTDISIYLCQKLPMCSYGVKSIFNRSKNKESISRFSSFEGRGKCLVNIFKCILFGALPFITAPMANCYYKKVGGKWENRYLEVLDTVLVFIITPLVALAFIVKNCFGLIHPGCVFKPNAQLPDTTNDEQIARAQQFENYNDVQPSHVRRGFYL